MSSVLDEYFKLVRKSYRRKGKKKSGSNDLNIKREVDFFKKDDDIPLHAPIFFQWRGDVFAHGVIYHCPNSKRITIAQVMGQTRQGLRAISIPLFLSLKNCYPSLKNKQTKKIFLFSNLKIGRFFK